MVLLLSFLMHLTGCSVDTSATVPPGTDGGGGDSASFDSSAPDDAEPGDADPRDTGARDSGARDTGTIDSGAIDSGAMDSGTADTGSADTGTPDTGAPDTGTPDTGTPDTGAPDTCDARLGGVPGYRYCSGTPSTQCDISFSHGFTLTTRDCNEICALGSMRCLEARDRTFSTDRCDRRSDTIGCGDNRGAAICICGP